MFAHPLQHLDKQLDDLPVIAIDSFRHMYLFPDFKDIFIKGKLKKFIDDLHSGKLHREFHYGPEVDSKEDKEEVKEKEKEQEKEKDKVESKDETKPESTAEHKDEQTTKEPSKPRPIEDEIDEATEEGPPDSTFVKLAPSEKRYTLLRNEL